MVSPFVGRFFDIECLSFILFLLGGVMECKLTVMECKLTKLRMTHQFSDESFEMICWHSLSNSGNLRFFFLSFDSCEQRQ